MDAAFPQLVHHPLFGLLGIPKGCRVAQRQYARAVPAGGEFAREVADEVLGTPRGEARNDGADVHFAARPRRHLATAKGLSTVGKGEYAIRARCPRRAGSWRRSSL